MLSNLSACGADLDVSQDIRQWYAEEGEYDYESDSDLDEFEPEAAAGEGTLSDLSTPCFSTAATNGMPHKLDTTTGSSAEPLETTPKGRGQGTRRILVLNVAFRT